MFDLNKAVDLLNHMSNKKKKNQIFLCKNTCFYQPSIFTCFVVITKINDEHIF